MRVVGAIVGLIAAGHTNEEILREYAYLEPADTAAALSYAAWRLKSRSPSRLAVNLPIDMNFSPS